MFRTAFACMCLTLFAHVMTVGGCYNNHESGQDLLESSVDERPTACDLIDLAEPVLGPVEFHRSRGKPVTSTEDFEVSGDGELCVVVTNGAGDPPHGQRISAAWISIDGEPVIGPDPFSQTVAEIQRPHPISGGEHQIGVKLASKPGSFLTVELWLLVKDEDPPVVNIEPANGTMVNTDMPMLEVLYEDDGVGVDTDTLQILLNGSDVTDRFTVSDNRASWQIEIDSYLEESSTQISVSVADSLGNAVADASMFEVQTPTSVLLADLESADSRYRKRSAYKLLFRFDQIDLGARRESLRQLNLLPEPKAVDRLLEILLPATEDMGSRALAARRHR